MIDTYMSSSETRWLKQSAIVLRLPHGLDGACQEHSPSRMERILQLTNNRCIEDEADAGSINMHVVFFKTPAQYFHLLRRQMKRRYRKPLVIVGPKGLLRLAVSSLSLAELDEGTGFKPVIQDPLTDPPKTKCIGSLPRKMFYDLIKERGTRNLVDEVSFVRIEELAPLSFTQLYEALESYDQFAGFRRNIRIGVRGGMRRRVESVLGEVGLDLRMNWLEYKGRRESAISTPGNGRVYRKQQRDILESTFADL